MALDGHATANEREGELRSRMRRLQEEIDPLWVIRINRGRIAAASGVAEGGSTTTRRGRRDRRAALEADVSLFLQQYARKTKNTPDPNNRRYDREVERIVRRLAAEELDWLMRGKKP